MVGASIANLEQGQKKPDVEISTTQTEAAKLLNVSQRSMICREWYLVWWNNRPINKYKKNHHHCKYHQLL